MPRLAPVTITTFPESAAMPLPLVPVVVALRD
jgi:hypothetical protein